MGCLKFIIKVAIVVLAIIGFKALGGMELFKNFHFLKNRRKMSSSRKV